MWENSSQFLRCPAAIHCWDPDPAWPPGAKYDSKFDIPAWITLWGLLWYISDMGLQKSLSIGYDIQMFVLFTKILVCRGSIRLFIGIFMPFVPF